MMIHSGIGHIMHLFMPHTLRVKNSTTLSLRWLFVISILEAGSPNVLLVELYEEREFNQKLFKLIIEKSLLSSLPSGNLCENSGIHC